MKEDEKFYRDYDVDNLDEDKLLEDPDLAVGLARWNKDFSKKEFVENFDILKLNGGEVAYWLARKSFINGWGELEIAQNLEVLKLYEGKVASSLAKNSKDNNWGRTKAARIIEVLELDEGGVLENLAYYSMVNSWVGEWLMELKGRKNELFKVSTLAERNEALSKKRGIYM